MAQPRRGNSLKNGTIKMRVRRTRSWRSGGAHPKGIYDPESTGLLESAPGSTIEPSEGDADGEIEQEDGPLGTDEPDEQEEDQQDTDTPGGSDESTSPGPNVENSEANATPTDGQSAATDDKEKELSGNDDEDWWKTPRSKRRQQMGTKKKATMTIAVVTIAFSLFGAAAVLPAFVMKQITSKLGDVFMDKMTYLIDKRTDKYIQKYFTTRLGMSKCGVKIDKSCNAINPSKTLFGNLYASWSTAKIETRLFNKFGLEFEVDTRDANKIKIFKTNANGIRGEVGTFGRNEVASQGIRAARDAVVTEGKTVGIRDRRHIRKAVEKYGGKKWCLLFCKSRDNVRNTKLSAVKELKLKILARVVDPISSKMSTMMLCFVLACDDNLDELVKNAEGAAKQILEKTDKELIERYVKEMAEKGSKSFTQFFLQKLVEKVVTTVMTESAGKAAASAVPIVGQVYAGLVVVDFLDKIDQSIEEKKLSKFIRKTNEAGYAQYYGVVRTLADEAQSKDTSLEQRAAIFKMAQGYNQSRAWQATNDITPKSTTKCEDGVTLSGEEDSIACPEKQLQPTLAIEEFRNSEPINFIMDNFVNPYRRCLPAGEVANVCLGVRPRDIIRPILKGINTVIGTAFGAVFSAAKSTIQFGCQCSLIDDAMSWIGSNLQGVFEKVAKYLLPSAINGAAEGAEMLTQTAAGFDVISNNYMKGYKDEDGTFIGLGTQEINADQSTELEVAIREERQEKIQSSGFFARYFDVNNTYSLASTSLLQLSSALPIAGTPMSISLNPLTTINGLAGLFSSKASASGAGFDRSKFIGMTQYAAPLGDRVYDMDPEEMTPENCKKFAAEREASAYKNEDTGETEYKVTNPCAVDAAVIDILTKGFEADSSDGSQNGPATTAQIGDFKKPEIQHDSKESNTCTKTQLPGTLALRRHIYMNFEGGTDPNKYFWTVTCKFLRPGVMSIHGEGRAQDIYAWVSRGQEEKGNNLMGWLITNAEALGIQYVKYWRVQWLPNKGISCVDKSDDQESHSTHVHYEHNWAGARAETSFFTSGVSKPSNIIINQDICPVVN